MKRCSKLSFAQIEELKKVMDSPKNSRNEFRRAQAILLLDEGKTSQEQTILMTRFRRRQIFRLRKNYLAYGLKAIKDRQKENIQELRYQTLEKTETSTAS